MRYTLYSTIILFTLSLSSCSDKLDPVYIINLDEQVQLSIKQDLFNKQSNVIFSFELNEPYECTNASMTTDINESILPNTTRIKLEGITLDGPCESGESTIPTELTLSLLPDNYGKHEFSIVMGDKVDNTGILHIKDNKFEFVLESEETILVNRSIVHFVPDSLIWVYIEFMDETYFDLANQKLAEIEELLAPMNLENGNFGHFFVKNDILFIENGSTQPQQGIKGKSDSYTPEELIEKVHNINSEFEDQFELKLFTWDGRKS